MQVFWVLHCQLQCIFTFVIYYKHNDTGKLFILLYSKGNSNLVQQKYNPAKWDPKGKPDTAMLRMHENILNRNTMQKKQKNLYKKS